MKRGKPARRGVAIKRVPLREQVYRAVVEQLHRGELTAGSRISDTVLAAELGVSRTPVREALMQLDREGLLEANPGRGFFVKPLSAAELRSVAPIFWTLQALAVRLSAPYPAAVLADLESIDAEVRRDPDDRERVVRLNLLWHERLIERCPNGYLRDQLHLLARGLRRHAHAYWRNTGRVRDAADLHAGITAALRRGDVDSAATLLQRAWKEAVDEMLQWMEEGPA